MLESDSDYLVPLTEQNPTPISAQIQTVVIAQDLLAHHVLKAQSVQSSARTIALTARALETIQDLFEHLCAEERASDEPIGESPVSSGRVPTLRATH